MAGMLTLTLSAAVGCNSRRRDSTVLQTESEEGSAIAFRSTCEFTSWPARYDTTRLPRQSLRRPNGRVRAPPTPHRLQLYRPRPPRSSTLAAALPATSTAAKAAVPAPSDRTLLNLAETAEQALEQRLLGVCGGIVTGRNIQEIWLAILDEASPPAQSKEGLSLPPL